MVWLSGSWSISTNKPAWRTYHVDATELFAFLLDCVGGLELELLLEDAVQHVLLLALQLLVGQVEQAVVRRLPVEVRVNLWQLRPEHPDGLRGLLSFVLEARVEVQHPVERTRVTLDRTVDLADERQP